MIQKILAGSLLFASVGLIPLAMPTEAVARHCHYHYHYWHRGHHWHYHYHYRCWR